jgi:MoaA/NifB/PqqE/SkfB family radical SAM enzyme
LEVSLLGLDAHERMTGGAARHGTVAQTLELVRRDFPAVPVRVKYVLTPWNHGDLLPLARWCRGRGLPLLVKLVESVASYTNALRHAENERSARFSFDPAARVEALAALEEILRDGLAEPAWARFAARCLEGDAPEGACRVPESSLFILSDGKVYGCRNLPPLGDLDAEGLDAILARRQRTPAGAGGREACGSCRSVFRVLFG